MDHEDYESMLDDDEDFNLEVLTQMGLIPNNNNNGDHQADPEDDEMDEEGSELVEESMVNETIMDHRNPKIKEEIENELSVIIGGIIKTMDEIFKNEAEAEAVPKPFDEFVRPNLPGIRGSTASDTSMTTRFGSSQSSQAFQTQRERFFLDNDIDEEIASQTPRPTESFEQFRDRQQQVKKWREEDAKRRHEAMLVIKEEIAVPEEQYQECDTILKRLTDISGQPEIWDLLELFKE